VLAIQKDTIQFQEILNKLVAEKEALKIELEKLKNDQKENEKKIKELKMSIEYLEKLIKDLRK
jgi:predicted  nucleic acid-binding Zn-ribbon protein